MNMYATVQDAKISPQQSCMLKVKFGALCIFEYACGIEHSCIASVCMWSACGRIGVTMVMLNKAYRERERLGRHCVSCPAPLGDSYTVTLFKDF